MTYLMYEDALPESMSQADYDKWFSQSFIHEGVRIGPLIPGVVVENYVTIEDTVDPAAATDISQRVIGHQPRPHDVCNVHGCKIPAIYGWNLCEPHIRLAANAMESHPEKTAAEITHHCPGCEAAARELAELQALCDREAALLTAVAVAERAKSAMREIADLKSDKAWADKLSAENADELSNLRREHEGMTGVPVICGCGDHIGYAEVIGLSQDGAVCGNCAVGRKDYDARMELVELRERVNMAGELADSYKHFYEVEIELAQQYYRDRESLHSGIERILADYPRDIKQDAEEAFRALLAETEAAK